MEQLDNNIISYLKSLKASCRELSINEVNFFIFYIEELTNKNDLSNNVIKPIIDYKREASITLELISKSIIYSSDVMLGEEEKSISDLLLKGYSIITSSKENKYLAVNLLKVEKRNIDSPQIATSLRAPMDAFNENIDSNINLIRHRLKDPKLTIEKFTIGKRSKTDVAVIYVEDIANDSYVNTIIEKLKNIQIDGVMESGHIQKLIANKKNNLFPEIGITEKPDSACANLLDGKVCVIVDGSNLSLIAPKGFIEFLDSGEDHYDNSYLSGFVKALRLLAMLIALCLSSFYVALVAYHPEVLPTKYVISFAVSRTAVPVIAFLEAFLMEIVAELLREGSIRLPKQIGPAIGIVGTIVIGQAAVSAGLVSPLMVIFTSLSAMSSFAIPDFTIINPIRLLKFILLILTGILGLYGLIMGFTFIVIKLVSNDSITIPYMLPISPLKIKDLKNYFINDVAAMKTKPEYLHLKDNKSKKKK